MIKNNDYQKGRKTAQRLPSYKDDQNNIARENKTKIMCKNNNNKKHNLQYDSILIGR